MSYLCPECQEKGIEKTFTFPTGLGAHRKFSHGIAGVSSSSTAARKAREKAAKGKAACFYCSRSFENTNGRSKHITAAHPGKSFTNPNGKLAKPVRVKETAEVWQEKVADKALVGYVIGEMKNECKHIARANDIPERDFIQMCAEYFMKVARL